MTHSQALGRLDEPHTPLYTPSMEPLHSLSPLRPPPASMAARRTDIIPARIYVDQKIKLTAEYEGNVSALFRFLLDLYFNDKLPDVRATFDALVEEQKQNLKQGS